MSRAHILRQRLREAALVKCLKDRSLIELTSLFTRDETARTMIVSSEVFAAVSPPFADTEEGKRLGEFRAWLDNFMEWAEITVSEDPFNKPPDVMLARVAPIEAEFWSVRVTEPEDTPGIRGFGAFTDTDKFITLTWEYRENIADEFSEEVNLVRRAWSTHFGVVEPFSGDNIDEYLTNCRSV